MGRAGAPGRWFGASGGGWFGGARTRATGALAQYYQAPQQAGNTPLGQVGLLAVDVETTGLDPHRDRLLSVGWIAVDGLQINLAISGYAVLGRAELPAPDAPGPSRDAARGPAGAGSAGVGSAGAGAGAAVGSVGHSATIHGITDADVERGRAPAEVLAELLAALAGRTLLAHYARLERDFLSAACQAHFDAPLQLTAVDTLELENRMLQRAGQHPRGEDLRLPRVRERYGLPSYTAHNALTDALACAELYLAQIAHSAATTLGAVRSR